MVRQCKKILSLLLLFTMTFSLLGCSPDPLLPTVKGSGFAKSEHVSLPHSIENITYYKPVTPKELAPYLPTKKKSVNQLINTTLLPFPISKESAYLITFQQEHEQELFQQVQLTYAQEKDAAVNEENEFVILRMTEMKEDPFANIDKTNQHASQSVDIIGNEIRIERTQNGVPLFQHIKTTSGSLVYSYYDWDETTLSVHLHNTVADEIVFYHQGILYQLAYSINENKRNEKIHHQMIQIAKTVVDNA
ncbi:hypothetical protein O0550_12450 [Brevibacillus halotolerans]|uniref:hypothetical protein n=1 Tax=Brevibacillus TaxID=55080 RepID=UPI00215D3E72|nr:MULTISPECIES: hypothetical protein [Brevibacillus]MCR8964005.1 hypothetical protein [Brevibacillus laterosporus]MCZ0836160.1 hypothetical protein [Brevibacillus halotolerans]